MTNAETLVTLDRCTVNAKLAPDARRVLSDEACALRAAISRAQDAGARIRVAKLRRCITPDELRPYQTELHAAAEHLTAVGLEAQRVLRMWTVSN